VRRYSFKEAALDINIMGIYINSMLFSFFISMILSPFILKLIDKLVKGRYFISYDIYALFIFLLVSLSAFLFFNFY